METADYSIGLDFEGAKSHLVLRCKACGAKTKFEMDGLKPGTVIESSCGHVSLTLDADDISKVQNSIDSFKAAWTKVGQTFKKLGK